MITVTSLKNFLNSCNASAEATVFCADIGSSSLKAALITKNGAVLSFFQQSLNSSDKTKLSKQWLAAIIAAAKHFSRYKPTICGICISGNGPTIVSEDGTTLLWNDKLSEEFSNANVWKKGTKSLFIPRLLGFRNKFPEIWKKSKFIFSGPEYLIYMLTGKAVTILPEIRYIPAYWSSEEVELFGIEKEKLPEFVPPAFNCGCTTKEITADLYLEKPVPVFCGAPDFIVALIGTNTLQPGKICDRAGSSEGLNLCVDKHLSAPQIRMLPSVIPGLWNASILFPDSGKIFSSYKAEFEKKTGKEISYQELVKLSLQDRNSCGYRIMLGLAEKTKTGLEILAQALEKANQDSENPCSIEISDTVTVTGGQAKTEEWIAMKANISGKTFEICSIPDSELSGDAALGWLGLGIYKTIQEAASAVVTKGKIFKAKNGGHNDNL